MAKKAKTAFFCQECGYESAKWMGKCPSCGSWQSFVEEPTGGTTDTASTTWHGGKKQASQPQPIHQIAFREESRDGTGDAELDRVLGGGIMPGSVVLIGGEPGIGKSTLLLQLGLSLSGKKILYVSGEESEQQIKMRADRLNNKQHGECYILTETNTQLIFEQVAQLKPQVLIIDSIQTLHTSRIESAAGSISQVRECAAELIRFAKESQVPVFLIGHITKDGSLAGPKILEHMVDTVLQFEGDRHMTYRILRTTKNRFGPTSELGIYEMRAEGLRQVSNPSEILLSQREDDLSGVAIGASLEGNRPLLIEIQSLVSASAYGTPQRSCTGFDAKRLNMLLAVIEKRAGFRVSTQDVFLNITGGLKVEDPAIDLAVCMSVISSLTDHSLSDKTCFAAEVGLGGEIRAINRIENRIAEAEKLGFQRIFISRYNARGIQFSKFGLKVETVSKLGEVVAHLIG